MQLVPLFKLLLLLTLANGTPIAAKRIFGARFALAFDGGAKFPDGRPWLGPSKTIRGVLASIIVTTLAAPLLGLDFAIGAVVAVTAMAGDLFSSFVKRRMNFPSSSQAIGLDQIPESLFPMLACRNALSLTAGDITLGLLIFFVGELLLSRLLFWLRFRDRPY